jgi:formylglycine-generating enzyme required for sulfatase activity
MMAPPPARRSLDTLPDLALQTSRTIETEDSPPAPEAEAGSQPDRAAEGGSKGVCWDDSATTEIHQGPFAPLGAPAATQERTMVLDAGSSSLAVSESGPAESSSSPRVIPSDAAGQILSTGHSPPASFATREHAVEPVETGPPTEDRFLPLSNQLDPQRAVGDESGPAGRAYTSQGDERYVTPNTTTFTAVPAAGPGGQEKKSPMVAIVSLAAALVVVLLAGGSLVWYYTRSGARREKAPVRSEETALQKTGPGSGAETPAPSGSPAAPDDLATLVPEGMVLVRAGVFTIGRDDGDPYAKPRHSVNLNPYYIDRTEVTNDEYRRFLDATGHTAPEGWLDADRSKVPGNWPVTQVTWQDAVDYSAWASKRLPTESEWEAAARGPDGRAYPWGNEWKPGMANIGTTGLVEVGRFKEGASPYGALDMIGNVWEWTADEFELYPGSTAKRPEEIGSGQIYRVIRGGAYDGKKTNDATYRGFIDASKPYPKVGFRCVKSADH